jgi:hypothetical protein
MERLPLLLALFFAGGIGRVLSVLTLGPANSLFSLLMWTELTLPIVLYGLWVLAQRPSVK